MVHKIVSVQTLGQVLQSERKQKGMTQREVAHCVGLRQPTVSSIEQGNQGTELGTLFRLLAALDLEMVIQPRGTKHPEEVDW